MRAKPKASIIIPNWNGEKYLAACLVSLEQQTFKDFVVIIVDNGSVDSSIADAEASQLAPIIIKLGHNTGFSYAVNRGIEASESEYVALLNNDTELDPDWLSELMNALETDDSFSYAASKMLHFDQRGVINTAGDGVSVYGVAYARGSGEADGAAFTKPAEVFGASAGAALYRKAMFDDIGLFDEHFFAYVEDVDICFRAMLRSHRCIFVPTAVVYHHVGGTSNLLSGFGQYYTTRNMLIMQVKDIPSSLYRKYWRHMLLAQIHWLITGKDIKRTYFTLKGYLSFLIALPYALSERKRIQSSRTISDGDLAAMMMPSFPTHSRLLSSLRRKKLWNHD